MADWRRAGVALVIGFAAQARADDVRGLLSACADGDMALCQQLESGRGHESGSAALDRQAAAFAGRFDLDALTRKGEPDLAAVYPRIVTDYFAAPELSAIKRARWARPDRYADCARHYHEVWIHERNWWPMTATGAPDWQLIYLHVMDHYFGYCVH
jgi:hypothetical protein